MTSRDTPDATPSRGRQALLWTLKIGVSAGLLYILFTRIDAADLWHHMRSASLAVDRGRAGAVSRDAADQHAGAGRSLLRAQHVTLGFGDW